MLSRAYAIRVADELTAGVGSVGHHPHAALRAPVLTECGESTAPHDRLVVVSDIDGTLLRPDGTASARTVDALSSVARLGHELLLATGRAIRDMDRVGELTGHRGRTVCANGGAIYDHGKRMVCGTSPFAPDDLRTVIARLADSIPGVTLAVEDLQGLRFVEGFPFGPDEGIDHPVSSIDRLCDVEVLQLLAWHGGLGKEDFVGLVSTALEGLAECAYGNGLGVVEINAPRVDKGTAVAELVDAMGLPADSVIAFGDMPNDLPLLRWAGTAYAMANAHPSVPAAVERRAPGNDCGGVALVLEAVLHLQHA